MTDNSYGRKYDGPTMSMTDLMAFLRIGDCWRWPLLWEMASIMRDDKFDGAILIASNVGWSAILLFCIIVIGLLIDACYV